MARLFDTLETPFFALLDFALDAPGRAATLALALGTAGTLLVLLG